MTPLECLAHVALAYAITLALFILTMGLAVIAEWGVRVWQERKGEHG